MVAPKSAGASYETGPETFDFLAAGPVQALSRVGCDTSSSVSAFQRLAGDLDDVAPEAHAAHST